MTRDEYLMILATEPATANQVGAILGQFERLEFGEDDRAGRLAVAAALLGLAELGSTRDLRMGEAGLLLRMLQDCPDRSALPTPAAAGGQDQDQDQAVDGQRGLSLAQAITLALALALRALQGSPPGRDASAMAGKAGSD